MTNNEYKWNEFYLTQRGWVRSNFEDKIGRLHEVEPPADTVHTICLERDEFGFINIIPKRHVNDDLNLINKLMDKFGHNPPDIWLS
jgi:hypothetical protein